MTIVWRWAAAMLAWCTFTGTCVAAQDYSFAGFDWTHAKIQAKNLQHPRSFPAGPETTTIFGAAMHGERRTAFAALTARLDRGPNESTAGQLIDATRYARSADEKAMVGIAVKNAVLKDANLAQDVGFAALVTGAAKYRQDAMKIMLALARLDPKEETSVAKEDLSAMLVARTLALGLDWFHAHWTNAERQLLLQAIRVRMEDFALKLVRGPRTMEMNPLVSHDNEVLGALAEVAILVLGDDPAADRWFDEFVPLYARLLTPFGGVDGGYANGTAYASWDVGEYSLRHWDTLRRAIGLDVTKKLWVQNYGRYLAYFLPPGTPSGLFGNGAEANLSESWARYAKAYAYRVPSPVNRWYAAQWFQENPSRLELLTSPVMPVGSSEFPSDMPNAAHFPSIGWVAMHSSLQDRGRTSLYFKSSPYGSVSHSHADQNSFVLNVGGRRLLIDSGYYDYFGSPHHYGWTTRTVAHNAMTFDGGKGQENLARPWGDVSAKGSITSFSTSDDMDMTVGDATPAYLGQLTMARRAVVYLRPHIVLVFDALESIQARKWEWNLHAVNKFVQTDSKTLLAKNADAQVCVHFESSSPTIFRQSNAFTAPPTRTKGDARPDQWHGQFLANDASTRFWSVAVMNVGCLPMAPDVVFNRDTATARINGRIFEFDSNKITMKY